MDINIEELKEYYKTHTAPMASKKFNLSVYKINKILQENGIKLHTLEESQKLTSERPRPLKVSKEKLYQYYVIENHNMAEVAEHFNISYPYISKLFKEYGITQKSHAEAIEIGMLRIHGVKNSNDIPTTKDKRKATNIERYGVDVYSKKNGFKEEIKTKCLEKYGVESTNQLPEVRERMKSTILERYGEGQAEVVAKRTLTMQEKYGVSTPLHNKDLVEKARETCLEKYGVDFPCMRKEARIKGNNSKPNQEFENLLIQNNIKYEREFPIGKYQYDFKINNILVEINPSSTHNSTWSFFDPSGLPKNYHLEKSKTAYDNGYQCIHIFDWDNKEKIINILKPRETIFARKCIIKEVDIKNAKEYLNKYHLQNYSKDQIRLGLYYNNELVSIMTFGKPRYNKNYEWELIRYCSHYNIIGGDEKLFKYFIKNYNPNSIVSYCDNSKFIGKIYNRLGFKKLREPNPSKHWYHLNKNIHITNNLLMQRGYDQLFKTNYGKGTSNEELMLKNGFVEIYDCGQQTYSYKKEQLKG